MTHDEELRIANKVNVELQSEIKLLEYKGKRLYEHLQFLDFENKLFKQEADILKKLNNDTHNDIVTLLKDVRYRIRTNGPIGEATTEAEILSLIEKRLMSIVSSYNVQHRIYEYDIKEVMTNDT